MDAVLSFGLGNALAATVLAVVAAAIGRLCHRPALLHSLWLLVLLKLLTPPLVPVSVCLSAAPAHAKAPAAERETGRHGEEETRRGEDKPSPLLPVSPSPPLDAAPPGAAAETASVSWKEAVAGVWLAGSVFWWGLVWRRVRRFNRLLARVPPAADDLRQSAERVARRLGLRRCPAVTLLAAPVSPMLWPMGSRPCVLLPAALWQRLSAAQREAILAHEMAHLRRRDHWVRWLEMLVLGLYWWLPVAWWARRELQEVEEQCCDAWVVWAFPAAAPAYAAALVESVAFLSAARATLPAGASGVGHVRHVRRRVTMILRGTTPKGLTWSSLLGVLALAVVLLPLWPSVGGQEASAAGQEKEQLTPPSRPAAGDKDALQQAEDEVELLQAQLAVKEAQLKAATLEASQPTEGVDEAVVTRRKAQVLVRQAEIKEPQVRLKQALRRLARLKPPPPAVPPLKATWAQDLFGTTAIDFGGVSRGSYVHKSRLPNTSGQTVRLAHIRTSSGALRATVAPTELAPGQDATVLVVLDAARFSGRKSFQVTFTFDRPSAATVVLNVSADRQPIPLSERESDPGAGTRLKALDKKLDRLLKEVDELRRALRKRDGSGARLGGAAGDVPVVHQRMIKIPFQVGAEQKGKLSQLLLFSTVDNGRTWEQSATATPQEHFFTFTAPHDGTYGLSVCTVDAQGRRSPQDPSALAPALKLLFQTQK